MKTVFKSPVGFFSADTGKSVKQIPKGKMWIHTVQFTTYELDGDSETDMDKIEFTIAAALPGELKKAGETIDGNLMARLLRQFATHCEGNKDNF